MTWSKPEALNPLMTCKKMTPDHTGVIFSAFISCACATLPSSDLNKCKIELYFCADQRPAGKSSILRSA